MKRFVVNDYSTGYPSPCSYNHLPGHCCNGIIGLQLHSGLYPFVLRRFHYPLMKIKDNVVIIKMSLSSVARQRDPHIHADIGR